MQAVFDMVTSILGKLIWVCPNLIYVKNNQPVNADSVLT